MTITLQDKEIWIDGSSTGMYGYCTQTETFIVQENTSLTNNAAEWLALYTLILDLPQGWSGAVYSDSMVVVNQFNENWRIKNPELKRIYLSCKHLCSSKNLTLELIWVSKNKNIFGKRLEKELKRRKKLWTREELLKHYM